MSNAHVLSQPCPKCKTGNFTQGRSLSMHLARHCTHNKLLWGQSTIKNLASKRRHEEMLAGSRRTLVEQAREFNKVPAEVTVIMRNPLSSLPALSHLAATQRELHHSNVNYAGFDVDFSGQNDDVNQEISDTITTNPTENIVIEKCPFERGVVRLPPDLAFQVHLLTELQKHRGNDLNMFDQINKCIKKHAVHHGVHFSSLNVLSRVQLIKQLYKYYNLHFLKPTLHYVPLSDGTVATVPIFDVKALLLAFLNDPLRMRKDNFASNYDIFTGKPTVPCTNLDEIHTGYQFEKARAHYCGNDPYVFPLALIAFYDKTHTDLFGSLACAPFIVIPSFLNIDCRNDVSNFMVLGYIPNLGLGKGKAKKQTSTMRLQDEHNCLRLITDQIAKIRNEGGFWTIVMGRRVRVVVWIHFIAGDTSGHNNIVAHFNGGKPKFIWRDCKCLFHQLSDPDPQCELITIKEMENARSTVDGLDDLCKKDIDNAFKNVPLSDLIHGLLGCVPAEMLHVSGVGLLKYMFKSLDILIGVVKKKKNKDKEDFDDLHRCLVQIAQKQSERDFPRMSVRNGITDGTKLSGSERVGNCFILLCVVHTSAGQMLIKPGLALYKIPLKRFIYCLKLYLAFEKWVSESHPIQEVKDARRLLSRLIQHIPTCFPREDAWGWNLPKMHALAKMIDNMLKFGMASNFSGQTGESALKGIVKDHAVRTQRRADKFAEQCAVRESESKIIDFIWSDISPRLGINERKIPKNPSGYKAKGEYKAHFSKMNGQSMGAVNIHWRDVRKKAIRFGVSDLLKFCLQSFSSRNGYKDDFTVTGYTCLKIKENGSDQPVIYYACEYLRGEHRYDFAMVQFQDDDNTVRTCPAKIIGFIKYDETPGIPTPHFVNDDGQSLAEISTNNVVDDNLYAVVHTSSDYLSMEKFQHDFICRFTLGDVNKCMYIIKVQDIVGPLMVFKNYGGPEKYAKTLFCALPKRKWGRFFSDRIYL